MARTRIGTKIIKIGGVTMDNLSSGSVKGHIAAGGFDLTASNAMKLYFAEPGAYTASTSTPRIHSTKSRFLYISAGGKGLNEDGAVIIGASGSNGANKSRLMVNDSKVMLDGNTQIDFMQGGSQIAAFSTGGDSGGGLTIDAGPSTGGGTNLLLRAYNATSGMQAIEIGHTIFTDGTGRFGLKVPQSGALMFRDTGSYIYSDAASKLKIKTVSDLEIESGRDIILDSTRATYFMDSSAQTAMIGYFTATGQPQRVIGDGRLEISDAGALGGDYYNIRFLGTSGTSTMSVYSGSTDILSFDGSHMKQKVSGGKLYFDGGTTYYAGSTAKFQYLTASAAYINSLEVDEIVSRTITKDSLEIKDNLIIAGVSGSTPGDYVGAGFQLGGKVGVAGTGSAPLMSLTLGSRTLTGDSLMVNVDGQEGASFKSGSVTQAALGKAGMRFGVTGSVSGSLVQAKRAELGHIAVGNVTSTSTVQGVSITGTTLVSGAAGTFHTTTTDKVVAKQINATSFTSSANVVFGGATSTVQVDGSLISNLSPLQSNKNDLGASGAKWKDLYIDGTGYFDAVDINGGAIDGATIGANSAAAGTFTAVAGTTGTYSGILKTDDTTAATSTTDGSLQTDGGLSVAGDAVIGDDIMLLSDAAVIHFGSDKDITLTHDADNGLRLSTLAANNGAGGLVTGSNIPSFVLHNASNSPADDDYLGGLYFSGMDDASNQKEYGSIVARAKDVTKDTTDGAVLFRAAINDTETTVIDFFDTAASTITVLDGAYDFNIASHDATNGLKLGGTLVSATAAELNLTDGAVAATVVGSKAVIYSTTGGLTGSAATIGGTVSGSAVTAHEVTTNKLHGTGIVTQDNMQTGSVLTAAILDSAVTTAKLGALSVTKAKLNSDVVINKTDANGGITYTSGRLSVGWRKHTFVRADGSNISGSVPMKGLHATNAVPTPYITASLGAQPMSGSIMVYLNGLLLHGDHIGNALSASAQHRSPTDYHLVTGSANRYKVLLHTDLALDSDDVLTVTYLSGSGTNS